MSALCQYPILEANPQKLFPQHHVKILNTPQVNKVSTELFLWNQDGILGTCYLSEASVANFQNDEKIWIFYVDKALLSDGKNTVQAKQ